MDWTDFVAAKLDGPAHRHKQASAERRLNRIPELLFMDFTAQKPSSSSFRHKDTARPLTGVEDNS